MIVKLKTQDKIRYSF